MKNFDLNAYGVSEMNVAEMQKVDGGIIPLLVLAAALLLSSCVEVNVNSHNGSTDNTGNGNGNSVGNGNGNN